MTLEQGAGSTAAPSTGGSSGPDDEISLWEVLAVLLRRSRLIVGSILVTWLLPKAFHSPPPYGTAVDILVGTVLAVIWVVVMYLYLAPLFGLEGWLKLILSALDAIGLAAVSLWVLRRIKR